MCRPGAAAASSSSASRSRPAFPTACSAPGPCCTRACNASSIRDRHPTRPRRLATPGLSGGGAARRGDDDFAGLKDYHPGDPPKHIAWKAYARADELLVKEFSGDAEATPVFDLADVPGGDLESRLSVLARWIVDAHARGLAFGLRLPGEELPPAPGDAQRARCLAAIARFDAPAPDVA